MTEPTGVAVDAVGNIYIADRHNHCVRKVDASGTISTFAGTKDYGFNGDGGPADRALLAFPEGVVVDVVGNVYIADTDNHRIRMVDAAGIIHTIAGSGERGFDGDGGPAISALLSEPSGVAVDSVGNVYIADTDNHRIRMVDTAGIIHTIAGSGWEVPQGTPKSQHLLHPSKRRFHHPLGPRWAAAASRFAPGGSTHGRRRRGMRVLEAYPRACMCTWGSRGRRSTNGSGTTIASRPRFA